MKLTITLADSVRSLLQSMNVDNSALVLAMDSQLAKLGDGETGEVRTIKTKAGKGSESDSFKIKGKDSGAWSGLLNAPMRFYTFNSAMIDLEAVRIYPSLKACPMAFSAWVENFVFSPAEIAEKALQAEKRTRANEASQKARDAILNAPTVLV